MKISHRLILSLVLIIILGLVIYWPSLNAPFQLDDYPVIVDNISIRTLNLENIWKWDPSRVITNFTFAINYRWHLLQLPGYHLINILLHILTSILIFFLTWLTLRLNPNTAPRSSSDLIMFSLLVTLIFLTHPIQTSTVTYVVQRSTLLASLWYLLALFCYIIFRMTDNMTFYLSALGCAILGVFCKPIIATLPLVLLLYEACFLSPRAKWNSDVVWSVAPFFLIVLLLPLLLVLDQDQTPDLGKYLAATCETGTIGRKTYFLTQLCVLTTYLRLLVLPFHLNLDYDYPLSTSFFQFPTWLCGGMLLVLIIFAVRIIRKHRLIGFAIFWYFITLSLESSIFPIADVIFEHRLYLAVLGFALLVCAGLNRYSPRKRNLVLAGLIAGYAILSVQRNLLWSDGIGMLKDVACKSPQKARVHNLLGAAYHRQGRLVEALESYTRAIQQNPNYPKAYNNRGDVLLKAGNYQGAIQDFNRAIALAPDLALSYANRGLAHALSGNFTKAMADFDQCLSIDGSTAEAYFYRGNLYHLLGDFDQALDNYNRAITLQPHMLEAYANRAGIAIENENYDQALDDLQYVLSQQPNHPQARHNMSVIQQKQHRQ
jgi:Flp pilus assembly protein TadD